MISSAPNNCLTNANNCSAMIAELVRDMWGMRHGEEARAVTGECDAWHECDMLLCDELLIGLCHCHHHSPPDNKFCVELKAVWILYNNCAEEITVISAWLSHSSLHPHIPGPGAMERSRAVTVNIWGTWCGAQHLTVGQDFSLLLGQSPVTTEPKRPKLCADGFLTLQWMSMHQKA